MNETRKATHDLPLDVRVTHRHPLLYQDGPDASLDRPPHVRAGSALARLGDSLIVVQDDALFLAVVDPSTFAVRDIPLPATDGIRTFGEQRGNKSDKLDLESCFIDGDVLFALGSGGKPVREQIIVASDLHGATPIIAKGHADALYAALWAMPEVIGAELNIEGAVVHNDQVLLFQRGNGTSPAVDAVLTFARDPFIQYLTACALGGVAAPCPPVIHTTTYDLGTAAGIRLTFTDGATDPKGRVAFLAAAEQSPDSYRDGPTAGVALGYLDASGEAQLALIRDEHGNPFTEKAEGLLFDPTNPNRALLVVDSDNPDIPCQLCELSLTPKYW